MTRTKAVRTKRPTENSGSNDLGALAMRQTAIVTLTDPRFLGKNIDTGFRVEIESMYSTAARDVVSGASAQLKIVKGEVETVERSFGTSLPEQVIAVTRRWWKEGESTDTITLNGESMRATPEHVRRVYEDAQFVWIQRQVQAAYLNLAGFFEPPKTA